MRIPARGRRSTRAGMNDGPHRAILESPRWMGGELDGQLPAPRLCCAALPCPALCGTSPSSGLSVAPCSLLSSLFPRPCCAILHGRVLTARQPCREARARVCTAITPPVRGAAKSIGIRAHTPPPPPPPPPLPPLPLPPPHALFFFFFFFLFFLLLPACCLPASLALASRHSAICGCGHGPGQRPYQPSQGCDLLPPTVANAPPPSPVIPPDEERRALFLSPLPPTIFFPGPLPAPSPPAQVPSAAAKVPLARCRPHACRPASPPPPPSSWAALPQTAAVRPLCSVLRSQAGPGYRGQPGIERALPLASPLHARRHTPTRSLPHPMSTQTTAQAGRPTSPASERASPRTAAQTAAAASA